MITKYNDVKKDKKKFSLWQRFLIWGGWLCECGGNMNEVEGWDRCECDKCGKTTKC